MKIIQNYIDGNFVEGKSRFANVNPAIGAVIAEVADTGKPVDSRFPARRPMGGGLNGIDELDWRKADELISAGVTPLEIA